MKPQTIADLQLAIPKILEQVPYLKLLVLFGSRSRGNHFLSSDWDFALLFNEDLREQYEPGGGCRVSASQTLLTHKFWSSVKALRRSKVLFFYHEWA
jgi:uncharacterized protein